jgi:hypothetical protein
MRTTLDLDQDILDTARALAAASNKAMGKVVSELARRGLEKSPRKWKSRQGVPVLPKRPGARVTNDFINRLREEEGV